jgi:hypothetical protein
MVTTTNQPNNQPTNQQTNQPTKELTECGDLVKASQRPSVFLAIHALKASLGSITDTLNYNWDCAYVNGFPIAVEDTDVGKLRTIAQEDLGNLKGHNFGWKNYNNLAKQTTKMYKYLCFFTTIIFREFPPKGKVRE